VSERPTDDAIDSAPCCTRGRGGCSGPALAWGSRGGGVAWARARPATRRLSARVSARALALALAAPAATGCGTPRATQQLELAVGGCLVGAGVVGGVTVGTSVVYEPNARDADGAFVPVADQQGVSLLPWGVAIAVAGLVTGGAFLVAGALIDVDEPPQPAKSDSTRPPPPAMSGPTRPTPP
jgi:hypothetical protein